MNAVILGKLLVPSDIWRRSVIAEKPSYIGV